MRAVNNTVSFVTLCNMTSLVGRVTPVIKVPERLAVKVNNFASMCHALIQALTPIVAF